LDPAGIIHSPGNAVSGIFHFCVKQAPGYDGAVLPPITKARGIFFVRVITGIHPAQKVLVHKEIPGVGDAPSLKDTVFVGEGLQGTFLFLENTKNLWPDS
jgi:hypothetical protein